MRGKALLMSVVLTTLPLGLAACSEPGTAAGEGAASPQPTPQAEAAETAEDQGYRALLFADVTAGSGIDFLHQPFENEVMHVAGGVVVLDFDNDGFQDIYVVQTVGPNALYRNNRDETFTDVAAAAGVDDPEGRGNGGCAADYDNDGDQDLYLTNYRHSKLFRNRGDGTFVDASATAGMDDSDTTNRSTGCAWGDYDQDGFLDFIVVRYFHEWDPMLLTTRAFDTAVGVVALYHNNGNGTFEDVAHLLGDTSGPYSGSDDKPFGNLWGAGFQPGWIDFDNDGDLDLYIVNDFGADTQPNVLWRNDGPAADDGWAFTDISAGSGTDMAMYGMALAVGDYDLDGDLDIFMTNIGNSVLLQNNGDGRTFTDSTFRARLGRGMLGRKVRVNWGAQFFDYDNDGDEDLYIVSGHLPTKLAAVGLEEDAGRGPDPQPNMLLENDRGVFADVSLASGADNPGVGRGSSYLDFNNDGCLDLAVTGYGGSASLYKNRCLSGDNWLTVQTVGTTANRDGIGARITLVAGGKTQIREVLSGASHMGDNMRAAHFGLGTAPVVDSLTVRWPGGKAQTLTDVATNQRITVTEPR